MEKQNIYTKETNTRYHILLKIFIMLHNFFSKIILWIQILHLGIILLFAYMAFLHVDVPKLRTFQNWCEPRKNLKCMWKTCLCDVVSRNCIWCFMCLSFDKMDWTECQYQLVCFKIIAKFNWYCILSCNRERINFALI